MKCTLVCTGSGEAAREVGLEVRGPALSVLVELVDGWLAGGSGGGEECDEECVLVKGGTADWKN